jgi:3-keto-disaccharide hydrolase
MPTISRPSVGVRFLAAAMLLVLGQAAVEGAESAKTLNNPPPGFTVLFNGQDFTGWRLSSKAKAMWSIEEGVLKAPTLLEEWGADLETEKKYQDFVLQADFRMPAKSDSGIFFRRLIPDMGNFGQSEQFKIRSDNGMGSLLSFQFMPENVKKSLGLEAQDLPQIKPVHPAIKVWHTVNLTVIGTRLMAELDGNRILDFQYPRGYLAIEPAPIRFQKHRCVEGANPGERNPCPIEYRNIFIKELEHVAGDKK